VNELKAEHCSNDFLNWYNLKNTLNKQIKALLDKAPEQVKKSKKWLFWCSDETRLGLHTIQRRKLTLRGVKPVGRHQ
jgi:hypothetical protein